MKLLLWSLLLLSVQPAHSIEPEKPPTKREIEEEAWGEEEEDEFTPAPQLPAPSPLPPARSWSLTGNLSADWGLWLERLEEQPWAKGRQSLGLNFQSQTPSMRLLLEGRAAWDAAYLYERTRYQKATLETYELRFIGGQQLIAFSLGPLELTLGRQIQAWGEGEMISPLDVVNPRDEREPGLAELEALRLSVLASRLGLFLGDHLLELMIVHESSFGEHPPPLGEFSPLPLLLAENPMGASLLEREMSWKDQQGRFALDQQQLLLRWLYRGPGLDLGLYLASVLDRQGLLKLPEISTILGDEALSLELDHRRYSLMGISGATALGAWIFRGELLLEWDRAWNTGDMEASIPSLEAEEGRLLNGMLGLSYSGLSDTIISLEGSRGLFLKEPEALLYPIDREILALRFSHKMLRERLILSGVGTLLGWDAEGGWMTRLEGGYELAEGLKLELGLIHYDPGEGFGPLAGLTEHDRFFGRFRWDFGI